MLAKQKNSYLGTAMLLMCAFVWGFAFVAQRTAADANSMNPIAFNGLRYVQAALALGAVAVVYELISKKLGKKTVGFNKSTLLGGVLCGVCLFVASNVQQYGIGRTSVGNASFITAMYIVFVPVLGLLTGKRPRMSCWYAVLLAVAGFYLLCINDTLSVNSGDLLILLCALFLSLHILSVDIFAKDCDPIKLTLVQFLFCAIASVPAMAVAGFPTPAAITANAWPLVYMGIVSAAIGFTLQTVGQKYTEPAVATLTMSLEAIIGFISGVLIFKEAHTVKELAGCLLVFIAVFMAQFEMPHTMLRFEKNQFDSTNLRKH